MHSQVSYVQSEAWRLLIDCTHLKKSLLYFRINSHSALLIAADNAGLRSGQELQGLYKRHHRLQMLLDHEQLKQISYKHK